MRNKIIAVIILVILAAGAAVAWLYYGKKPPAEKEIKVSRNLTDGQKKIYTDKLAKDREYLKTIDVKNIGGKQEQSNVHLDIGQQYYGLGEISKALQEYQSALNLDRSNINALVSMSLAQTEIKDYLSARTSLEQAKQIAPSVADTWLRYIQLTLDHFPENVQDVKDYYEQALTATSRNPDILSSYAQYQEKNGNLQAAQALWKEASQKVPQNQLYLQEYKRLGGK